METSFLSSVTVKQKNPLFALLQRVSGANKFKVCISHRDAQNIGLKSLVNIYCTGFEVKQFAQKTILSFFDDKQALDCELFIAENAPISVESLPVCVSTPAGCLSSFKIQFENTTIRMDSFKQEVLL